MKAPRAKTVEAKMEVAELAKNFNLKAFVPELPDPREFSSNEVMGQYCDRQGMVKKFDWVALV